jgi:hypothetical protein
MDAVQIEITLKSESKFARSPADRKAQIPRYHGQSNEQTNIQIETAKRELTKHSLVAIFY